MKRLRIEQNKNLCITCGKIASGIAERGFGGNCSKECLVRESKYYASQKYKKKNPYKKEPVLSYKELQAKVKHLEETILRIEARNEYAPKAAYAPSFYTTDAWRKLRFDALKKYGPVCMLCKITNVKMHVDHIQPRSKRPDLEMDINNLQILCEDCNLGKSNRDESDFR